MSSLISPESVFLIYFNGLIPFQPSGIRSQHRLPRSHPIRDFRADIQSATAVHTQPKG
ncbi:hypothetical protein NPIL_341741, partial [Nephila pilipes]